MQVRRHFKAPWNSNKSFTVNVIQKWIAVKWKIFALAEEPIGSNDMPKNDCDDPKSSFYAGTAILGKPAHRVGQTTGALILSRKAESLLKHAGAEQGHQDLVIRDAEPFIGSTQAIQ